MALNKDFIVRQGLQIEGTLQSYSTSTGALQVAGGLGVGGNTWIGGSIQRYGDITVSDITKGAGLRLDSALYTDPVSQGTVPWSAINYFGTSTVATTNTSVVLTNAATFLIEGAPQVTGSNVTIVNPWGIYLRNGNVYLGGTDVNTSTYAGNALQVNGGISGKGLYITGGGNLSGTVLLNGSEVITRANQNVGSQNFTGPITILTTTNATSVGSGALVLQNGGLGVYGNAYIGGYLAVLTTGTFLSTQNATSTSTGALTLAGGLGVGQDLFAQNGTFVSGLASTSTFANNSLRISNGGGLAVSGTSLLQGQTWVTDITPSTDVGSGALVVKGGVGVGGTLSAQDIFVADTTPATALNSAPLVVQGGAAFGQNVIIGSNASSTSTTASNSLYVYGGVGIGKDIVVAGNAIIHGSLTLLDVGTQLTVNSTQTYIVDPVIDIGGGANNSALSAPDVFDKGLMIHYNNGSTINDNNHAFIGYEHTRGRFIVKKNIYPGASNVFPYTDLVNTGSYATFDAGSLNLYDTTVSSDPTTGALVVAGGAGVSGKLNVADTSTFTSPKFSLSSIADNAVQIPDGGLGANYIFVKTAGFINGAQIITTGTVNAGIGGNFTNTFHFTNLSPSYNPGTGAVVVDGGFGVGGNVNIGGTFVTSSTAYVWATTSSASPTTGALIVAGGVGVGENLNVGSKASIGSTVNSTSTANGALVVAGGVGIAGNTNIGNDLTVNHDLRVGNNATITNSLTVNSTVDSVTSLDGALVVAGGLGVAKTINATRANLQTLSVNSGSNSTGTTTGDVVVAGGIGVGLNANIGGDVNVLSTTSSNDPTSGALTVKGGVGVGKDFYVAGSLVRTGDISTNAWGVTGVGLQLRSATYTDLSSTGIGNGTSAIHSIGQPTLVGSNGPEYDDVATMYIGGAPLISGTASSANKWALMVNTGQVKIGDGAINNGTTNTGALQVAGGVGVGGNLTAAGTVKANQVQVVDNLISSHSVTGINTTVPQTLDSFVGNRFRTAKYIVQITDTGTPNKFHVVEVMLSYDGSGSTNGSYISQYGIVTNTGELGTFDADYSGGFINLRFTPNYIPTSMNIQAIRMALTT